MNVFICFSAGVITGAAIAAFFTVLGLFTKLSYISETEEYVNIYVTACFFGVLTGALLSLVEFRLRWGSCAFAVFEAFAGIFIGTVVFSLSEVFSALPLLKNASGGKRAFAVILCIFAVGKLLGGAVDLLY